MVNPVPPADRAREIASLAGQLPLIFRYFLLHLVLTGMENDMRLHAGALMDITGMAHLLNGGLHPTAAGALDDVPDDVPLFAATRQDATRDLPAVSEKRHPLAAPTAF